MTTGDVTYGSFYHRYYHKQWSGTDGRANFMNPYSMIETDYAACDVRFALGGDPIDHTWPQYGPSPIRSLIGTLPSQGPLDQFDLDDNAYLDMANSMISDIRGSSFDMSATLAEVDKTATSVVRMATKLYEFARNPTGATSKMLRSAGRNVKSGSAVAKATAENWLQYKYELKPMANDVANCVAAVQHPYPIEPIRVRAVRRRDRVTSYTTSPSFDAKSIDRVSVRALTVVTQPLPTWAAFGLNNIAGAAWERVPFSFVVDWILPIGPWLGAYAFPLETYVKVVSTKRTRKNTATYKYPYYVVSGRGYCSAAHFFGPTPFELYTSFTRSGYLPFPASPFTIRSFPSKVDAACDRIATAMSLLLGQANRVRRY
jgi:hypothetical protein